MVTIADVAQAAGVSVATVSRVMNGSPLVAEATAQIVRDTIERLAYVPNLQARNLRKNESRTVLVLLPNITNPYYANVFSGINQRAQELGYTLYLRNTSGEDAQKALKEAIDGNRADGAILLQVGFHSTWLKPYAGTFPLVQCCEFARDVEIPHICVDNFQAAREATEYLLNLGCRKVGIISADNDVASTIHRVQGYRTAMEAAGLEIPERYMTCTDGDYGYPASLVAAKKLLSQPDPPEALFCIGDSIALAAVVAAGELGLKVPEDVSVVGFDDVIFTQMIHPYLTTVIQPCAQLGSGAMDMLHSILTQGHGSCQSMTLPHGFAVRESTGAK